MREVVGSNKKPVLTKTQKEILSMLREYHEGWLTPHAVAERLNLLNRNPGAAAASLRRLVKLGLVKQRRYGWYRKNTIGLFDYQSKEETGA